MKTTIHTKLLSQPGVIGFVECNESGLVVNSEGDEAELLGAVLVYFEQMTNLIGETLGLDRYLEAQIYGKSILVHCQPLQDSAFGLLMNSKARLSDLQPMLNALRQES